MKKRKFTEEHRRKIGIGVSNFWKNRERIPWNKGLTKETYERVKRGAEKIIGHSAFGGFETRFKKGTYVRTEESKRKQAMTISGEGNPNWRGGISKKPYGFDFTDEVKQFIKVRDGFKCMLCDKEEGQKSHHVHHIDYDKENNEPDNLITLCPNCHAKTNFNRNKWKRLLRRMIG